MVRLAAFRAYSFFEADGLLYRPMNFSVRHQSPLPPSPIESPNHFHPSVPNQMISYPCITTTMDTTIKNGPVKKQWTLPQRRAFKMQTLPIHNNAAVQIRVLVGCCVNIAASIAMIGNPQYNMNVKGFADQSLVGCVAAPVFIDQPAQQDNMLTSLSKV